MDDRGGLKMVPQKQKSTVKAYGIYINQKKARMRGGYKRR